MKKIGAEKARTSLPELLDRAEKGEATVITRRGKPAAILQPIVAATPSRNNKGILALKGSGRGMWPKHAVQKMRDEWS